MGYIVCVFFNAYFLNSASLSAQGFTIRWARQPRRLSLTGRRIRPPHRRTATMCPTWWTRSRSSWSSTDRRARIDWCKLPHPSPAPTKLTPAIGIVRGHRGMARRPCCLQGKPKALYRRVSHVNRTSIRYNSIFFQLVPG